MFEPQQCEPCWFEYQTCTPLMVYLIFGVSKRQSNSGSPVCHDSLNKLLNMTSRYLVCLIASTWSYVLQKFTSIANKHKKGEK